MCRNNDESNMLSEDQEEIEGEILARCPKLLSNWASFYKDKE